MLYILESPFPGPALKKGLAAFKVLKAAVNFLCSLEPVNFELLLSPEGKQRSNAARILPCMLDLGSELWWEEDSFAAASLKWIRARNSTSGDTGTAMSC